MATFRKTIEGLQEESTEIKKEVRERTVSYLVAALGVVAGLAWNDAVKALLEFLFPLSSANSLVVKFLYAILVTFVVVLLTVNLVRLLGKEKK